MPPNQPIRFSSLATPFRRFPVTAQLAVLTVILGFIFVPQLLSSVTTTPATTLIPPLTSEQPTNAATITLPQKINDVAIIADSAYVWDVTNQRVLYAKNPNTVLPLASLTKLMTTLVTTELMDLGDTARVSQSAVNQEGNSGLMPGESISFAALSELALLSSSNDAAHALAASVGSALGDGNDADQFIRAMNIRAGELGLSTLQFKNATGLDISTTEAGAYGTARDMTFLLEYLLRTYPDVLTITQADETRVSNEAGEYHTAVNTNRLVSDIPNLLASKTGYTDLAGGNLIIAYDAGFNRPIIITVLSSSRDGRFADVMNLISAVNASLIETNN